MYLIVPKGREEIIDFDKHGAKGKKTRTKHVKSSVHVPFGRKYGSRNSAYFAGRTTFEWS